MKLIHKATGAEVKVGDTVKNFRGEVGEVEGWTRPSKPSSEGHLGVILAGRNTPTYSYASVWGCEWAEREDRADQDSQIMRINAEDAKRFEETYKGAVADGSDTFVFRGKFFATSYAKYLCEYLRSKGLL